MYYLYVFEFYAYRYFISKKSQRIITDLFDYVTGRDYKEMNCPMERSDFIRRYCITAIN